MKTIKKLLVEILCMFGLYSILGLIIQTIRVGFEFNIAYQLLFVSVICSLLRYIFYSEDIIKGKSYTFRNILFFITFLPTLCATAYIGEWFPIRIESIMMFLIIFFLIGGVMSVYFHYKMKKEGFVYTQKLNEFKKSYDERK